MQDCSNSSALAKELLQSYTRPSIQWKVVMILFNYLILFSPDFSSGKVNIQFKTLVFTQPKQATAKTLSTQFLPSSVVHENRLQPFNPACAHVLVSLVELSINYEGNRDQNFENADDLFDNIFKPSISGCIIGNMWVLLRSHALI